MPILKKWNDIVHESFNHLLMTISWFVAVLPHNISKCVKPQFDRWLLHTSRFIATAQTIIYLFINSNTKYSTSGTCFSEVLELTKKNGCKLFDTYYSLYNTLS